MKKASASPGASITKVETTPNQMDFPDALRAVLNGERVTKLDWNDPEVYVYLKGEFLMIHINGEDHTFIIRDVDMRGKDWIDV
jgi:hypothetical protein